MNKIIDKLSPADDTNIESVGEIATPKEIINKLPITKEVAEFVETSRLSVANIILGKDKRVFVTVGPCSIHNPKEALEYAKYIKEMQKQFPNLLLVMRVYFEKPRTNVGWKGLINDPNLDGSYDVEAGLEQARALLLEINKMGVPVATEFLDTLSPQYFADLITWGAVGARTTESQLHRELASGLSAPIGFKNGTDGNVDIAINAIKSASSGHNFLGATKGGKIGLIKTTGNKNLHVILRGGKNGTNYDKNSVNQVINELEKNNIDSGIMIDCSHANSEKNHKNQEKVCKYVANQIEAGNKKIMSVMIESNLKEGAQKFDPETDDKTKLISGLSITDACVDLETTTNMLSNLDNSVKIRNKK